MEPLSANDPRTIGEFRLHSRLGAGGMGQVYLGFSPAGRAVAIKVIHSQFAADPEFLRRFSHEVTAARAVGGMYTAPVVDSSVSDKSPWLATAYVPGPPLAAVVAKYGALPEQAVWRLAAGLTEALRAVHGAGVIHRDLKPANVLLADDGPHLIDFGISRPSHATQLTTAGMVIGTPGYMSPEQAKTGVVDPATDIFSLGCVLAYSATGNPPFAGDNPAAILFRIVSAEPDLGAIPPRLRQVIDACLRKEPAQRPGPADLIAMINALGPETPASLGSFWPEDVSRVIAAEQSSQTPTGLTPPTPMAAPSWGPAGRGATATAGSAGMPSGAGMSSAAGMTPSAPAERPATALAAPTPGLSANPTGHAPMLSDGYYSAASAQGWPTPAPAPPGPSIPSMPPVSPPAQPYAAQQPYLTPPGAQAPPGQPAAGQSGYSPTGYSPTAYSPPSTGQPGYSQPFPGQPGYGQAPSGQAAYGQASSGQPAYGQASSGQPAYGQAWSGQPAYGQASFEQPGLGTPAPYAMQAPSYPGYSAQQAGGAGALGQYAPGRRKPTTAEVPGKVRTAVRLMYLGLVVTALDVLLSALVLGRYIHAADVAKTAAANFTVIGETRRAAAETAIMNAQNTMTGAIAIGFAADLLGLACWIWLAVAARRGKGWTRVVGTVLLGVYSVCALFVLFGTKRDPGPMFTTALVWGIGVAALIALWSQQAREFFFAWRRR